jgi:hypothetical protein
MMKINTVDGEANRRVNKKIKGNFLIKRIAQVIKAKIVQSVNVKTNKFT